MRGPSITIGWSQGDVGLNVSTLKGSGSQYMALFTIHKTLPSLRSYFMHLGVWNPNLYIVLHQGEYKNVLDIVYQNTMYVLAFKGTQAMYLNLNLQCHQGIQPVHKVLEEWVDFKLGYSFTEE